MRNAQVSEARYGSISTPSVLYHPLAEHAMSVIRVGNGHWRLSGVMGFRLAEYCKQVGLSPPNPLCPERTYTVELRGY
jgi:hypothetical protein